MDRSLLTDTDREMIAHEKDHDVFISSGFICEIKRHPSMFFLCGYVYVPKEHPSYGKDYDNVDYAVHGGLTFARSIFGYWVFGFDCGHAGDYNPGTAAVVDFRSSYDTYRNWDYVLAEVEKLAFQLAQEHEYQATDEELAKLLLTQ